MQALLRTRSIVALLLLLLVLTGCGGGSDDPPAQTSSSQGQSTQDTALTGADDESNGDIAGNEPDTEAEAGADANTFDADGDGFLTVDEHEQAFETAFSMYRWPDEYTPTVATMLRPLENSQPGDRFQIELEHTVLASWNQCAWYMAWLAAFQSGDTVAQEEALHVMMEVLPAQSRLDAVGMEAMIDFAETAALGDSSQIVSMVEGVGGCRDLVFDGPA